MKKNNSQLPWPPQTEEMEQAFAEIYSSGDWCKYTGDRVKRLEQEFPPSHDCRFGVSVCNGSVAIDIALKAVEVKPGDEVILPAYDFYSLPKSVLNLGATPVFADVNPENFTIDKEEVKRKITHRTKAIIGVHISGSVAELDALVNIASQNDIHLIEDCAQAHGAIYGGRKVGSWADLAIFSFGGVKLMTCGQGGMITTSDEEFYKRTYAIVNRGQLPDGKINPYGIIGENFQLSEIQAAIVLPQISLLESYSRKREEAFGFLDQQLSKIDGIEALSQFPKTQRRAHMRYSFCYKSPLSSRLPKQQLIRKLIVRGIPALPAGAYSSAPADQRLQGVFAHQKDDFPHSRMAQEEIVGIHHTFLLNQPQHLQNLVDLINDSLNIL
ncbi:MAG: aminotransferase class I/II-fold pyridoxal phosphate-dependent enzyme [candidate division Zixibacteria bacterium]|nr:aminotransferase class I/II-fold pyridoxal phosphate-dependent enzyme [candidate division Zixibacteria bacterium]